MDEPNGVTEILHSRADKLARKAVEEAKMSLADLINDGRVQRISVHPTSGGGPVFIDAYEALNALGALALAQITPRYRALEVSRFMAKVEG